MELGGSHSPAAEDAPSLVSPSASYLALLRELPNLVAPLSIWNVSIRSSFVSYTMSRKWDGLTFIEHLVSDTALFFFFFTFFSSNTHS